MVCNFTQVTQTDVPTERQQTTDVPTTRQQKIVYLPRLKHGAFCTRIESYHIIFKFWLNRVCAIHPYTQVYSYVIQNRSVLF